MLWKILVMGGKTQGGKETKGVSYHHSAEVRKMVSEHTVLTSGEDNDKLLARFRGEVQDSWQLY